MHPTVRPNQPASCSPTGDDEFTVKDVVEQPLQLFSLQRNPRFHPPPTVTSNPRSFTLRLTTLSPSRVHRLENTPPLSHAACTYTNRDVETKDVLKEKKNRIVINLKKFARAIFVTLRNLLLFFPLDSSVEESRRRKVD